MRAMIVLAVVTFAAVATQTGGWLLPIRHPAELATPPPPQPQQTAVLLPKTAAENAHIRSGETSLTEEGRRRFLLRTAPAIGARRADSVCSLLLASAPAAEEGSAIATTSDPSSLPVGTGATSAGASSSRLQIPLDRALLDSKGYREDVVVRTLDGNTVKLSKSAAAVKLWGISASPPAGGHYPDCYDRNPDYRIRQILPAGTAVFVKNIMAPAAGEPAAGGTRTGDEKASKLSFQQQQQQQQRVVLIRSGDGMIVNAELVRSGAARVRVVSGSRNGAPARGPPTWADMGRDGSSSTDTIVNNNYDDNPGDDDDGGDGFLSVSVLRSLEKDAKDRGVGMFTRCDEGDDLRLREAEFEPIELTTESQWNVDGGRTVLRRTPLPSPREEIPPPNPGDTKGCSDFATYEEALKWYETYLPYYGDVARLDRKGNGVPCPGLPHTKSPERYRMKVPASSGSTRQLPAMKVESS